MRQSLTTFASVFTIGLLVVGTIGGLGVGTSSAGHFDGDVIGSSAFR